MQARTRRFRELDGLRGVAAALVVFSHYTGSHNASYPDDPPPLIDIWWGGTGVQLFFLISGFVILMSAEASKRPSDFVVSRFSRLFPAYWLSLAFGVVLAIIFHVPHIPLEPEVIAANLSMVQRWFLIPNVMDVYWTLAVEMQFYVLMFVLMVFTMLVYTKSRITDRLMVVVAAIWLAVALIVAIWAFPASHGIDPQLVATPVKIVLNVTLAAYGPLFCTGMLAYISRRRGRMHWLTIPAAVVAPITTGLLQNWETAAFIAVICAVFLIVTTRSTTPVLLLPPLQWLGKVSYSLYLTHSVIGLVIIHALWPYVGRQGAVVIAIAVALLVAWGLYEVAEKRISPALRRWLSSLQRPLAKDAQN